LKGDRALRAPAKKRGRKAAAILAARLNERVTLEAQADGTVAACFDGYAAGLGKISAAAMDRAQGLRKGLPLDRFVAGGRNADQEIDLLVRRLGQRGLLEYRLGDRSGNKDQVVIEPQIADYWPQTPKLLDSETIVLSRFAYLRRRGNDFILESPRAGALFRICNPKVASAIATLSIPQKIGRLRRQAGFPGLELLGLLMDSKILFKIDARGGDGRRANEGDEHLVLWDFHDLLFHTHSTEGRQANPLGGLYSYADITMPPPAVRSPWPGKKIDLEQFSARADETNSPYVKLLRERHSVRDFDDHEPITLAELAHFLESTARVQSKWTTKLELDGGGPDIDNTTRPYPGAGSAYELEFYLAVTNCKGLERGFYHYDADRHALVPIAVRAQELDAQFQGAAYAMDVPAPPQVLITIAARFNRISWKYASIAYALILKDVGVLIQTLYMMATDMGLGGCAIGTCNIDLFAKMTGIDFHIEGPVGQFALGRGVKPD
jgi:SagB-type dehydrogenase family enzyme